MRRVHSGAETRTMSTAHWAATAAAPSRLARSLAGSNTALVRARSPPLRPSALQAMSGNERQRVCARHLRACGRARRRARATGDLGTGSASAWTYAENARVRRREKKVAELAACAPNARRMRAERAPNARVQATLIDDVRVGAFACCRRCAFYFHLLARSSRKHFGACARRLRARARARRRVRVLVGIVARRASSTLMTLLDESATLSHARGCSRRAYW